MLQLLTWHLCFTNIPWHVSTSFTNSHPRGRLSTLRSLPSTCYPSTHAYTLPFWPLTPQVVKDNELGALVEALDGKYTEPGPGGDPIRNPAVLPTGKNIHALDPQSIPTQAALKSAALIVERLLDRERDMNGGKYPETIALVLWGTDNIKTYGESLAQVGGECFSRGGVSGAGGQGLCSGMLCCSG